MRLAEAAARVERLLGDEGARVLVEARASTWAAALSGLPDGARSEAPDLAVPGLGVALAAREAWRRAGEVRVAAAMTRAVAAVLAERLGDDHPDVLAEVAVLGALALQAGRADRAVDLLHGAWQGLRAAGAVGRTPAVVRHLVDALTAAGRAQEASSVLERAVADLAGTKAEPVLMVMQAEARLALGDRAGAGAAASRAWSLAPTPALARSVGRVLLAVGEARRAVDALRVAVASAPAAQRADLLVALLQALEAAELREEATRTLEVALEAMRMERGPGLAGNLSVAARALAARGRSHDAEACLLEAVDAERARSGGGAAVGHRLVAVGRFLAAAGRLEEASGFLEAGLGELPDVDPERAAVNAELLDAALRLEVEALRVHDKEAAAAWRAHALSVSARLPPDHPARRRAR